MSETKSKSLYNPDTLLDNLSDYFFTHDKEKLFITPLRVIYSDFASKNPELNLPKFSQARRIIIDELKKYNLINSKENLTTEVAYRLIQTYNYYDELEFQLKKYPGILFDKKIIPCVIPLPSNDVLDDIVKGIQKQTGKKTSRQLLINRICRTLKKKHKNIIIAAISDSNPIAMYKLSESDISPQNLTSSICLYVLDNEEGREFIQSLKDYTSK